MENLPSKKQSKELQLLNPPTREERLHEWMMTFCDLTKIDEVYSSTNWGYTISNPKGAYINYTPRLMDIDNKFGWSESPTPSADWIKKQVLTLWAITPDTNDAVGIQAELWAKVFAAQNKTYNLGELMVFFARCMAGVYPCGYTFDLTRVGSAFERFKEDWKTETLKYEEELRRKRAEAQAAYDEAHWVSRSEYNKRQGLPEDYDPLAKVMEKAQKDAEKKDKYRYLKKLF